MEHNHTVPSCTLKAACVRVDLHTVVFLQDSRYSANQAGSRHARAVLAARGGTHMACTQ